MTTQNFSDDCSGGISAKLVELMVAAIGRPPGIKVVMQSHSDALRLRRQLYGARRRARYRSNAAFDSLSILVQEHVVMLIMREAIPAMPLSGISAVLPLGRHEVPGRIGARGPAKPSIVAALLLEAMRGGAR